VVRDLVDYGVLLVDGDGRLATKRPEDQKTRRTPIFSVLTPAPETKEYDQANALVRWLVEIPGDTAATFTSTRWNKSTKTKTFTLGDKSLQDAWVSHVADGMGDGTDLCMAEGRKTSVSSTHMKAIRKSGDGAKLISSNDTKGFSFRGRFIDAAQASTIGYVASQKAHIALKWLIQRQGYATDDQQVVAWSIRGFDVPDPMRSLLDDDDFVPAATCDLGEFFANKLKLKMAGYLAKLPPSDRIALIVLDSAVPGRLAVRMYRDYGIEEYIGRLEKWHAEFAWPRKFFVSNNDAANPQKGRFVTAPAAPTPLEVAKAAYGHDIGVKDKKLCRLTVERMTPCIVDAAPVPRDLVVAAFNRAVHRSGQDEIAWENTLATACSLHRGRVAQTTGEIIDMSLDLDRNSRDYLYGRLLAYGEKIELVSQGIAKEKRETNVAKLFSRFAAHPAETWQQIEALLMPYKARVRGKYDGFLEGFESEIDKIFSAFQGDDFARDQKLGPEYLLGYHCQRQALAYKKT
jgi:CRISPR-associated protein Csd1